MRLSLLQPTEQFTGQGAGFGGGSVSYSQPGLSGVRVAGHMGGGCPRLGLCREGAQAAPAHCGLSTPSGC